MKMNIIIKIKKSLSKITAITLTVTMLSSCIPQVPLKVFAADPIAKMNGKTYTDFSDLVDAIYKKGSGNEKVTIDMLNDWDYETDKKVKQRIIVPEHCSLTLNMHGCMFNRRLTKGSDYDTNGELFLLEKGARVTINGGPERTEHSVVVHSSTNRKKYADTDYTTYGGTLSGGSSTNGAGCFHMNSSCTLTLNNVTIAGCRAEQSGGSDGHGGAIYLECPFRETGSCTINLTDSLIYGCYAYNDGGAIYSDGEYNAIKLRRSRIENNYCGGDGGAIYYNYAKTSLSGDGKSSINGNKAAGDGGAIYVDHTGLSIAGLNMTGNHAYRGGAIYINDEETVISNCIITDNGASFSGGGVYVVKNITDLTVKGATVIKDSGHNLYISDSDPDDTRVTFDLSKGADVHVSYYTTDGEDSIMVTPGKKGDTIKSKNCINFLTSDTDGYHFYFGPAPNDRKIYLKKGKASGIPTPERVHAIGANNASGRESTSYVIAGKVGTVGPGGVEGDEYDLIRGFYQHEATDSGTVDNTGLFYYTDAFFDENVDPNIYNEHLATSSWSLAFAGTYLRKFESSDAHGNRYYDKHAGARQFLADIGCPDQNIYVNDSMVSKPGTDTVGCTIGSKELVKADGTKTGKILIPVTVRGGGYESEWASNCTLGVGTDDEGRDGEAVGFSTAADQVVESVDKYIKRYGLEDEISAGNVVFWVSGFSRAGATANITSKRLVEKYADGSGTEGKNNRVFGYTCEAAQGGTDKAQKLDPDKYYCIHNMVNTADMVPLVAPWQMGFKRYGVDHYIPGTAAGEIKAETKEAKHAQRSDITHVTSYSDNKPLKTKTSDYDKLRDGKTSKYGKSIYEHLRAIDPYIVFDDYFHPMAMNFLPSPKIYENGDYDNNRVEDFLEDFFRGAQEGLPDNTEWSKTILNRSNWAEVQTYINGKTYPTVQEALRDTMVMIFNMDEDHSESFMEKASEITNYIQKIGGNNISMFEIYRNVIGSWHDLYDIEKESYIRSLLGALDKTGALDVLEPEDAAKLEKNWPTLADFIFHLVDYDYNYKPGDYTGKSKWAHGMDESMTLIPTFATFASYILTNHYPEVNIAWVRMNDDWYMDEGIRLDFKEYKIEPWRNLAIPGAYVIESEEGEEPAEKELTPDDKNANVITGDQKIILENKDVVGESVFYDVKDITQGEAGEIEPTYNIYRGGVDLTLDGESKKIYKIYTFDMSYGVKSDMATYYINLIDDKHEVIVKNPNQGGEDRTYEYREGDVVCVNADILEGKKFTSWIVTDENNTNVTNRIFEGEYSGGDKKANTEFKMPAPDDAGGFSRDYALTFTANYDNKISDISVSADAPFYYSDRSEGKPLDDAATVSFNSIEGKTFTYPVTWTYETGGKEYIGTGDALPGTVYTAHITIPQGEKMPDEGTAEIIEFAQSVTAEASSGSVSCNCMPDGSVQLAVVFPATDTPSEPPTPPQTKTVKLTIKAYDQNMEGYIPDEEDLVYNIVFDEGDNEKAITVSAKSVEDEFFAGWNALESGIVIDPETVTDRTVSMSIPAPSADPTELTIQAEYIPLVKSMKVALTAPVGGEEMAATVDSMTVKITDEYTVDPECVNVRWTPDPEKEGTDDIAAFGIPYTATVTLKPYAEGAHSGKIMVTDGEGHVSYISATFGYADTITATMNGEAAFLDRMSNSLSYTFPATKYELAADAESPADVTGLPHETGETEIRSLLPETNKILRNDGMEVSAEVRWDDPAVVYPSGDQRGEAVWTVSGNVILPENMINPTDAEHPGGKYSLGVSMNLTTEEAAYAASPEASLPAGTYRTSQEITLSTSTDGGEIYYTLDGSDPSDPAGSATPYDDEHPISVNFVPSEGEKTVNLRTCTKKEGMWDSAIATYIYTFTNAIPVPAGETFDYIGAEWTLLDASRFYKVVPESLPEGCKINDDGDLVATEIGTYKVTLHIGDDYAWETEEGSTTDDQEVTFRIIGCSLSEALVTVLIDPYPFAPDPEHPELKPEPPVRVTLFGEEIPAGNYDVIYEQGEPGGKPWKVKVAGKGFYADETDWTYFDISDDTESFTYEKIADQTYTGKAIKPKLKVYFAGKPLTEKKDYTITYKGNVKASSQATFIIKGKGNYSGTEKGTFTILPRHILDEKVSISEIGSIVYNRKKPKTYKPVPKLKYNGKSLKKGRDFTVKYYTDESYTVQINDPKDIGHYYAVIEGMKNYTGSACVEFDILDPALKPVSKLKVGKIADQPYTGEPVDVKDLNLVVKDGNKKLTMGVDYEAYTFSIDAGKAEVTICGIEEKGYFGVRHVYYNITGIPMKKVTVTGLPKTLVYDGTQKKPEITLSYKKNSKSEVKPVSYTTKEEYDRLPPEEQKKIGCLISYGENKNIGKGTVTLTGVNECSGTVRKTFKITKYIITPSKDTGDQFTITLSENSYAFAKAGVKPKPEVRFKGELLKEKTDYTLTYSNNKKLNDLNGTRKPTVKVKGKGCFAGTDATTFFKIIPADMAAEGISVAANDVLYKNKAGNWKSKVTLTDKDGKKLTSGKDYDKAIRFTSDEAGENLIPSDAKLDPGTVIYVTVKAKEGSAYTGSVSGSYMVVKNDIGKLSASVEPKIYTGEEITLSKNDITWKKNGKRVTLPEENFEIIESTYKKNINKGKASVEIRGKGDWGGRKTVRFKIVQRGFVWWVKDLLNL